MLSDDFIKLLNNISNHFKSEAGQC